MAVLRGLIWVLACAAILPAELRIFPLKDLKPGLRGTGRTVFAGTAIEEFGVEILGVLENVGPAQSVILARLSGGPLEPAGVLQGMSGSPVYVGGKLVGAVAMAFPFSKEPIAGIRPIEEMLGVFDGPAQGRAVVRLLKAEPPPRGVFEAGGWRLTELATPVSFGGFTERTLEHFAPELRALGLEPAQGVSSGSPAAEELGDPRRIEPGSMISVQLLSGDLTASADGTVTCVDGRRVWAFGHRLLSIGGTELPFARAEVIALLPNLSASFKISAAREWMGTITEDRSTAIGGELGRRAALVPVSIRLARHGEQGPEGAPATYRIRMVNDRFLAPFLLQMAVFSAIDATERTLGLSTFSVRGRIEFQGAAPPVRLDNMYAGDFGVPALAAAGAAVPLAYALQSGFEALRVREVSISIDAYSRKKLAQIDQVLPARTWVRPGEEVELKILLAGPDGAESTHPASYRVPVGSPAGPLMFTVSDGASANLAEYQQFLTAPPKSAAQVVSFLNGLRGNSRAYVRVWRQEPGFVVQGEDLPDPPASVALILARAQSGVTSASPARGSTIAEMVIGAGETVVTGSKTVQVEVKE